ncbi:MAG: hypothetical protein MUF49_31855 [Oculatellaceae cyanobacterium Prado106]|jgi:twitching motility protein PilJ|nr:hypothetical protein [Oculatellaceae cyanobacterium Prado106]
MLTNDISNYQPRRVEPLIKTEGSGKQPGTPANSKWTGLFPWFNRNSLRTKATAITITLGTVPIILVGSAAYVAMDRSFTQQVEAEQANTSIQMADKLNRFIFERYGDIQVLANLPFLRNAKVRNAMTVPEQQQILDQYAQTYRVYDSIAVFDLQGNLLLQTKGDRLTNPRDRNFFQAVLKGDRPLISTPQFSEESGSLSLYFAAPVRV